MATGLADGVLALVQGSGVSDSDQRSALGMARTWLEKGQPIVRAPESFGLRGRDDLAEALIGEIAGMDKADAVEALGVARDWVNAPFVDPSMNGQKFGRAKIEKPGGNRNNGDVDA